MIPITSQCSGMAAIGPIHGGAAGSTCASDRALSVADRMRAVGSPSAVPDSCVNAAQRCAASDFAGVAADWAHVGWTINSEAAMYPPKCILRHGQAQIREQPNAWELRFADYSFLCGRTINSRGLRAGAGTERFDDRGARVQQLLDQGVFHSLEAGSRDRNG